MKFSSAIVLLTSVIAVSAAPTAEVEATATASTILTPKDLGNGPDINTVSDPAVIYAYIEQLEAVMANREHSPIVYDRETAAITSRATVEANTDYYCFTASLNTFIAARNAKADARLDWSADGCSSSPDKPAGFDFLPRCYVSYNDAHFIKLNMLIRCYRDTTLVTVTSRLKADSPLPTS
jgi:hypothetical protein